VGMGSANSPRMATGRPTTAKEAAQAKGWMVRPFMIFLSRMLLPAVRRVPIKMSVIQIMGYLLIVVLAHLPRATASRVPIYRACGRPYHTSASLLRHLSVEWLLEI